MRRSPAWWVVIGAAVAWAWPPAAVRAADGFWVNLAAGAAGSSGPSSTDEFWFDTPHGPPPIAVTELSGGTTAKASTGGGDVFFGGSGTPVLLNTTNGSAYVAGGNPPDAAVTASAKGAGPASGAPSAGPLPSNAALLGVKLADPDAAGARALTATLNDPNGSPIGTGTVGVPDGGWWVIGLTPGLTTDPGTTPPPVDPPPVDGGNGGGPVNPPPPGGPGGPVATPEPAAVVLVALGGLGAGVWRRLARRKTA